MAAIALDILRLSDMTCSKSIKLYFITSNRRKYIELKRTLGVNMYWIDHDIDEIQGDSDTIISHKLMEAKKYLSDNTNEEYMVVVDDTCFEMAGLNGFPGPYGKDFLKMGFQEVYEISLKVGNQASIMTNIGFSYKNDLRIFQGRTEVQIGPVTPIQNKLCLDAITYINGKPISKMSLDEKNLISARSKASKSLKKYLESCGSHDRII